MSLFVLDELRNLILISTKVPFLVKSLIQCIDIDIDKLKI